MQSEKVSLELPDYSDWRYPTLTRLITKSEKCVCTLCEIARDRSGYNYVKFTKKTRKTVIELAPTNSVNTLQSYSEFNYNDTKERIRTSLSPKQKEHLLCILAKGISSLNKSSYEKTSENGNELILSQEKGRPMRVSFNQKTRKRCFDQISADDL